MSGLSFERETVTSPRAVVPAFLFIGLLQTMVQFLRVRNEIIKPHIDVRCCWRPLSRAVLSGQPLYVRPAVDNKPPLFELLNLAVAATGQYFFVFFLLVGLANAAAAIFVWRVCDQHGAPRAGLVAGLLFLSTVPVAGGISINVRSFAIAGIVLALTLRHPVARGAAVAAAGMFSQHAVFAIPVLAYLGLRERGARSGVRWFVSFALAGLCVVASSFAVVYAIWGVESLQGALYWTFGAAESYTTDPAVPSLIGNTDWWVASLVDYGMGHLVVLVPAAVVLGLVALEDGPRGLLQSTDVPVVTAALLAASMALPLLVRAFPVYWLYPMPYLAMLASVGFEQLFTVGKQ